MGQTGARSPVEPIERSPARRHRPASGAIADAADGGEAASRAPACAEAGVAARIDRLRMKRAAKPTGMAFEEAARCLAELGHPHRLQIFRLLIRAGGEGLSV